MPEQNWHDYNIFDMPPGYVVLVLEVNILCDYIEGAKYERRRVLGYYDPLLGKFRDGMMHEFSYEVVRWALANDAEQDAFSDQEHVYRRGGF